MLRQDHQRIMKETAGRQLNSHQRLRSFDGITKSARFLDDAERYGIILEIWKALDDESRQALLCELHAIADPITGTLTYRTTQAA